MDYVFVVYSKEIMKMNFGELEEMLVGLVEEARVCYNGGNGR